VFQRWPSVTFDLTPVSLGPLLFSARAGLSRFAPIQGFENASAEADLAPFDRRLAANRADARAEVAAPLLLGRTLLLEPYLRGAALGYLFDARLDPIVNAWGVAGARLSSEISRSFATVRHALVPFVDVRAGTAVAGEQLPVPSYDLWDRGFGRPAIPFPGGPVSELFQVVPPFALLQGTPALPPGPTLAAAPPGPFEQLRAGVETRLTRGTMDLLRLAVGQDIDLRAGRLAETWATGTLLLGPLALDALARFYADGGRPNGLVFWTTPGSWLDHFTAFRAGATVTDHRGDSVHAGILSLAGGASPEAAAGIDALFDQRQVDITPVGQANAGARVVLGPATVTYDIFVPGRPLAAPVCTGGGTGAWTVQQQTATFVWNSPCRCFRASVALGMSCGRFNFSAGLSLSGTGSIR
jgi:LPS-assembly protein